MIWALVLGLLLLPVAGMAQAAAPPDWQTWRDPNEGAFTAEVPRGWSVAGGLVRQPSGNTVSALELRSPDGTMEIGVNDRDMPSGILPVPIYAGMPPGTPIGPGAVLAAYETGEAFAQEYGAAVFGRACGRPVQVAGHQPAPVAQSGVPGVPGSSSTAGLATFRCDDPQHGFLALAMARTDLMPFTGTPGGVWSATMICRVAASTEAALPTVLPIVQHVLATLRPDPQWELRESQAQLAAVQARASAGGDGVGGESVADYRRRVMGDVAQGRASASQKTAADFADYAGDQQRLINPATGQLSVAQSGFDTYTLTPSGILGTVGPYAPDGQPLQKTNN